jgi:hypothetical protein
VIIKCIDFEKSLLYYLQRSVITCGHTLCKRKYSLKLYVCKNERKFKKDVRYNVKE